MTTTRREWLIPAGLILLSLVPMLAGSIRLAELSGNPEVTPDNARFVTMPLPVVVHIVSATRVLPARRVPVPPRPASSAPTLAPAGRSGGGSGGDRRGAVGPLDGVVRRPARHATGRCWRCSAWCSGPRWSRSSCSGWARSVRRDVVTHGAWMTRGYALGQGAGTQALILGPFLVIGMTSVTARALLMGLAWVLNLAVAEWVVRRRRVAPDRAGHRTPGASRGALRLRGRSLSEAVHGAGRAKIRVRRSRSAGS